MARNGTRKHLPFRRDPNDSRVHDLGMIEQNRLELGRGYLDAFHLDELLLTRVLAGAMHLGCRSA